MAINNNPIHWAASTLYTFGIGQVLCIPGVLISGIASSIFGLQQAHYSKKQANGVGESIQAKYEAKKVEFRNKALNCAAAASFFALGAIPLVGGVPGLLASGAIKSKKTCLVV